MKYFLLIVSLVAAVGCNPGQRPSGTSAETQEQTKGKAAENSDSVDQGPVAPEGEASVLGRWMSPEINRGNYIAIIKLRIQQDRTTFAFVCKYPTGSVQAEQVVSSRLDGETIYFGATHKQVVTENGLFCMIPDMPESSYRVYVQDNVLTQVIGNGQPDRKLNRVQESQGVEVGGEANL